MIPRTTVKQQITSWQSVLASGVKSAKQLLSLLQLNDQAPEFRQFAEQQFATRVPLSFVARMQKANPSDPLLLQVLASSAELQSPTAFSNDPLQEQAANPIPGLLHKYHGRVLLIASGTCAINCRYCFRRHFEYDENHLTVNAIEAIYNYLANDTSINEVILSGGDPLLLSDRRIEQLCQTLNKLAHITTLRIHTRIPIVLTERINPTLFSSLNAFERHKVMVIHSNHANEIDSNVRKALTNCKQAGFHLLNQSVLLRGINDDSTALINLSHALFNAGVLPYYLHLLDKVSGTAEFEVPMEQAKQLNQSMIEQLPGYLVPKFVYEQAGALSKLELNNFTA